MTTFDHFAYGSNMSIERLRQRCPSAQAVTIGFVIGRQLRFHKIGIDGTGKADAFWTGDRRDCVWGVVVRCRIDEKPVLDQAETVGIGYDPVAVEVHTGNALISTFLYEAKPDRIDVNLRPASWYHRHLVTGARQHSLPPDYQRMIQSHHDQNDEGCSLPPIRRHR